MPRVPFAGENKVATVNYDFPKLKLKHGEKARVLVGLEDPLYEYVHTLRKPTVINGEPVMETATRKDKTTYETNKMAFVTRALCLGDATLLDEKGSDPRNCPMCKLAKDHPDYGQPPQRRYAMHVIRYRTKAGTTDVASPFSAELLVWSFTDKVFNKIADAKEEWGDLRKHDLLLGPCTSEGFQQFDIGVGAVGEWLTDEDRKKFVVETFRENKLPDLTIAIGNVKQRQWIDEDIESIHSAWAEVREYEKRGAGANQGDLQGDLDSLLGSSPAKAEKEPAGGIDLLADLDAPEGEGTDELLASVVDTEVSTDEPEEAPAEEPAAEEAPEVKPAPAAKPASVDNFDDLLSGL